MVDFYYKSIVVEELERGNPSFPGRKAMTNLDSVLKNERERERERKEGRAKKEEA